MDYILPQPSKEQKIILDAVKVNNLIVDSVAGSGKTTTILHIAKDNPQCNILLLTYNKKLKFETREKRRILDLNRLEIHSYHSFAVSYLSNDCFTDSGMIKALRSDATLESPVYDMIIIDEAQDMSVTYFELVCKQLQKNQNAKICVIGDKFQSIFEFMGSDSRFIQFAELLFTCPKTDLDLNWMTVNLSISYRITSEMADFINKCVISEDRIKAIKNGPKPKYMICNAFTGVYSEVIRLLKKYKPEEIFVLAKSVKSQKSPLRKLANKLSDKNKTPLYIPIDDDKELDEEILQGKLVFSTFHQSKGLERKVVIIYGFDDSYFRFSGDKDADNTRCPNDLYVALTRAKDKLILLHHFENDYLPFLRKDLLCNFAEYKEKKVKATTMRPRQKTTSVTDLTKHLSSDTLFKAKEFLHVKQVNRPNERIEITTKTKQGILFEEVSDITGVLIPSYYQFKKEGKMFIYDYVLANQAQAQRIDISKASCGELLRIANVYCALRSGYFHMLNQITDYSWIDYETLNKCIDRLGIYVVGPTRVEIELKAIVYGREIIGFADVVNVRANELILWELKCVYEIKDEHILQLAIYAYLWHKDPMKNKIIPRFMLLNIQTAEIYEIKSTPDSLEKMVKFLIHSKYHKKSRTSDNDFLNSVLLVKSKYFDNVVKNVLIDRICPECDLLENNKIPV